MTKVQKEIYDILNDLKILDAVSYNALVLKYNRDAVNSIIDQMIDESESMGNLSKFEYYVSNIVVNETENVAVGYAAYMSDIVTYPCYNREENQELIKKLHKIIIELEKLFVKFGYYDEVDTTLRKPWIADKVEYCLKMDVNSDLLKELNLLYKKFLSMRNVLIEGNLRLVVACVKKFYRDDISKEDMIQLGNIGFIRALEKYNPRVGTSLSTYAYYWIRQSVTRGIASLLHHCDVSVAVYTNNISRMRAVRILTQQLGVEPTDQQVADYTGIPLEKIIRAKIACAPALSLDSNIKDSSNDSNDCTSYGDMIADERTNVEEKVFKDLMNKDILEAMSKSLTEREIYVLTMRYGFQDGMTHTLEEVGEMLGVTRERIRQIENKATTKMRKRCANLQLYLR